MRPLVSRTEAQGIKGCLSSRKEVEIAERCTWPARYRTGVRRVWNRPEFDRREDVGLLIAVPVSARLNYCNSARIVFPVVGPVSKELFHCADKLHVPFSASVNKVIGLRGVAQCVPQISDRLPKGVSA